MQYRSLIYNAYSNFIHSSLMFFLLQEPGQDPPLHLDVVSQSPLVELNFSVVFFLDRDTGKEYCPAYFVEGPRFGVCLMIPPD